MKTAPRSTADVLVAVVVLIHFGVGIAHGTAHILAPIGLSPIAMAFVLGIIGAGPLLGLALQWFVRRRAGAWIVAATLGASFVFGITNHYVLPGADRAAAVVGPWGTTFRVTAALLAITEALGALLAARCATAAKWTASSLNDTR
jgi:hypothetical protein